MIVQFISKQKNCQWYSWFFLKILVLTPLVTIMTQLNCWNNNWNNPEFIKSYQISFYNITYSSIWQKWN